VTPEFFQSGWAVFPPDPGLRDWVRHAIPAAKIAVADPAQAHWLRCGGTWFGGVNILPNNAAGAVAGSGPLDGPAVRFVRAQLGLSDISWDRAQVSVVHPGYPRPSEGETDAAFRFRRDRDAAHVDGLLPIGLDRRRMIREPHGFVLGVPLTETNAAASPMVIWEGSHQVMRTAFAKALREHPPETWGHVDVTDAYHAARREVFRTCARVVVHSSPGQAYLIHRLALHGVSPWQDGAIAPPEGRMIAYFRPEMPGQVAAWLTAP